ncbi:MAG: DNA mismatch repair protein MutS [Ruminococcaceae bacterium]|nr:DNA mismatch repair protein MutS [Oscillospiraceae bacterium]
MRKITPMMEQYFEIKEQYKDAILFFRLGDFYEMFYEDAEVASRVLDITLTGKSCGGEEKAPMCGVPFHSADGYIATLVSHGYKVAICEQVEDPKATKGIVRREVVRIVTPGTTLDENILAARGENYICSVYINGSVSGVTFCEASTGQMQCTYFEEDKEGTLLAEEIVRMNPAEIIYNLEGHTCQRLTQAAEACQSYTVLYNDLYFDPVYAEAAVEAQFGRREEKLPMPAMQATGALLSYLDQTQKMKPLHITDINLYTTAQFMEMDMAALNNLELYRNMRDREKKFSLYWVLDASRTTMGSRALRAWVMRPLINCTHILARHTAVEEFVSNPRQTDALRERLSNVSDMERVTGRVVMGTANPRDLIKLQNSLAVIPEIKTIMKGMKSPLLAEQEGRMEPLYALCDLISRAIVPEPPQTLREGNIIREGFSEALDELRHARDDGASIIAKIEAEEKERTDIKNLRIRFNKVFGYYIEVSNSNLDKVPADYIRKQTTVGGERFITEQLKEVESVILGASEKIVALEYQLFQEIRNRIAAETASLQRTAHAIGTTDALASLGHVALRNRYVRPEVDTSEALEIRGGRHPVVEAVLKDGLFVPNDALLDTAENRLAIITGPNMAGKSTYMRQIALIAIMAQMGSFVPAEYCRIGIVDKVFTRIGASDDLSTGRSTFMVEMSEVSDILRYATKKSLLVLDEIGRGTSTYDGLSIAWAVLEHCVLKIGAKTLFATHYHELTKLEDKMEGVVNYNIAARKRGDDIIFLRKIVPGGTDDSYGIEVARLAGVPEVVTKRAKQILHEIEEGGEGVQVRGKSKRATEETGQIGFATLAGNELLETLRTIDAETLSPIEALNTLYKLTKKAKEI